MIKTSQLLLVTLLSTTLACRSVKYGDFYENRLTRERVEVMFVGDEAGLTRHYGQKFKYQYDEKDSPFVVYTGTNGDRVITTKKEFLRQYSVVK